MQLETNKIVSCGGGVVLRNENVSIMKENGMVVMLTASPEEIYERVKNDNGRPLLQGRKNVETIRGLMERRRESYENAADIIIYTDGKTKEAICREIMNEVQRAKERKENEDKIRVLETENSLVKWVDFENLESENQVDWIKPINEKLVKKFRLRGKR